MHTTSDPQQGWIQRLKKGGENIEWGSLVPRPLSEKFFRKGSGHETKSGVGVAVWSVQRAEFFLCERITHSVLGGSGRMLP